jgi:hypothetical protein
MTDVWGFTTSTFPKEEKYTLTSQIIYESW